MTVLEDLTRHEIPFADSYPLAKHSSFRIGGCASLAVFPRDEDEIAAALRLLARYGKKPVVIGNSTNVLFPDEGLDTVLFTKSAADICVAGNCITASAGASLTAVANAACNAGLTGAEFLYGIPGTVGGAVFMNAGAYGGTIADACVSSVYFDPAVGEKKTRAGEEQEFGTRKSFYTAHPECAVLSAKLELRSGDPAKIRAEMEELMTRRKSTQPLEYPSAGSVFKRPEGHFAGKLIEDCGLKGTRVGDAEVSLKHAGFIVNRGHATARDVKELVALIQKKVFAETGVPLEPEIRFL